MKEDLHNTRNLRGATVVLLWCYCGATVVLLFLAAFAQPLTLTLPQVGFVAANGLCGPLDTSDPHGCNGFYQTHGSLAS